MTCKNCLHCEICEIYYANKGGISKTDSAEECKCFEDKTLYVKLPCDIGDIMYYVFVEFYEICEAKVINISRNYYTPDNPFRVTIEYQSCIGKQEENARIDLILNERLFYTREEAEQKLKEMKNE